MIIRCPITNKKYIRHNLSKYHAQDCPFCNSIEDKLIGKKFKTIEEIKDES